MIQKSQTNLMKQVVRNACVAMTGNDSSRQSPAVRFEQKSVSWMKNSATKVTNARKLVLNPCAGTFTTAKVCMMFLKHWSFICMQS